MGSERPDDPQDRRDRRCLLLERRAGVDALPGLGCVASAGVISWCADQDRGPGADYEIMKTAERSQRERWRWPWLCLHNRIEIDRDDRRPRDLLDQAHPRQSAGTQRQSLPDRGRRVCHIPGAHDRPGLRPPGPRSKIPTCWSCALRASKDVHLLNTTVPVADPASRGGLVAGGAGPGYGEIKSTRKTLMTWNLKWSG